MSPFLHEDAQTLNRVAPAAESDLARPDDDDNADFVVLPGFNESTEERLFHIFIESFAFSLIRDHDEHHAPKTLSQLLYPPLSGTGGTAAGWRNSRLMAC